MRGALVARSATAGLASQVMSNEPAPPRTCAGAAFWERIKSDPDALKALWLACAAQLLLAKAIQNVFSLGALQDARLGANWGDFQGAYKDTIQATRDELAARYIEPPESLEDWEHLARVVEKDPERMTLHDIYV